nr:integrase, catalytic region, zinc finger, CCHC-type, peptidase aspartic, catalytic [Tanacetum cinerariifolium]
MFLWAEAVATMCYTQNRSLIHTRHHKTPYELVHNKKPDLTFFRVFGVLCYPTNDSEDLRKIQPTADTGIFVGYAPSRKGSSDTCLSSQEGPVRAKAGSSGLVYTLSRFLLDNNFSKGAVDPTLFTHKTGKHILHVQIYVDDITFASTDPKDCDVTTPKWATAEFNVPGTLLHNIPAEDTRERPLNMSFEK